jgi:hypothetical protein
VAHISAIVGAASFAGCADATELLAGGYSFSDELGGFRLISASGSGTPKDPVVLVEEIDEVAPVTLVIRLLPYPGAASRPVNAQLAIVKQVVNRSERVWAGFELELQEILRKPSEYGDGLSFNQFSAQPPDVASDAFTNNDRLFEPYDRIAFHNGHVDPNATVAFRIVITDPTPVNEFYLVQDPKLLSVQLPQPGRSLALRRP